MHRAFLRIFSDLEERYQVDSGLRALLEAEIPKAPKPLRADARLCLLVNLHQMVVAPLSDTRSPIQFDPPMVDELRIDVQKILGAAAKRSGTRNRLAASHIILGASDVMSDLYLKSWRLWDLEESPQGG